MSKRSEVVAVVGLGYVGRHIQAKRISAALESRRFHATTHFGALRDSGMAPERLVRA